MSRRSRRYVRGLVPRLGRGLLAAAHSLARHPQPLILAALLGLSGVALWGYARHADAFRVTSVSWPPQSSFTLREPLIGANLLAVDLRSLSEELQRQQPWLKEVRVTRQLPNAIRIDPIQRRPVAQLRIDRWYPLDREGVVLPNGRADPDERLVRFTGIGLGRTGKIHADDDARIQLALRVLQALQRAPATMARRVSEINVVDPQAIRLVLDGGTEVRCGSEAELDTHLARLREALKAIAKQPLDARYIDVRFQEPVIGPRTS